MPNLQNDQKSPPVNPSEKNDRIAFGHGPKGIELHFKKLTFKEFAKLCSVPKQGGKHEGWFLRGGDVAKTDNHISSSGREYGPGYYRGNKYLKSADFIIIDGDCSVDDTHSAPDPKLVHSGLKMLGLNHFIYTSHSHTENKNKFRAVIPCVMSKDQLKPTAQKIIDDLNKIEVPVKYVREMGAWAQLWYLPTRDDPEDGLFKFYEYYDGSDYQAVDSFKLPNDGDSGSEKSCSSIRGKSSAELNKAYKEGHRHGPSRSMAMKLASKGHSEDEAVAILCQMYPDDNEEHHRQSVTSAISKVTDEVKQAEEDERKKYQIPVPILQELADEIYKRQRKKSYLVAVVFALTLAARATARKYFDTWQEAPASIYTMFVGDSGVGKELLHQMSHALYQKAPNSMTIRGFPESKAGYIADLQDDPASTNLIDEFGLKILGKDKHFKAVCSEMMQVYGRSGSVHKPGSYTKRGVPKGDRKKLLEPIISPCPNLVATSTWAAMVPGFSDFDIVNGFYNRFIPFISDGKRIKRNRNPEIGPLNEKFTKYAIKVWDVSSRGMVNRVWIEYDDDAENLIWEYSEEMDSTKDEMLHKLRERRFENAVRLSNILAAWKNPEKPVVDIDIAKFTLKIMRNNCELFDKAVMSRYDKKDHFDKAINGAITYLQKHDGKASHTKLANYCSHYKNFRHANLTPSESQEQLRAEMESRGIAGVYKDEKADGKKKPMVVELIGEYAVKAKK